MNQYIGPLAKTLIKIKAVKETELIQNFVQYERMLNELCEVENYYIEDNAKYSESKEKTLRFYLNIFITDNKS